MRMPTLGFQCAAEEKGNLLKRLGKSLSVKRLENGLDKGIKHKRLVLK